MSKKNLFLIGFAILVVLSSPAFAQQKLNLPFRDVGACPFECCTYREWTVNKNTVLLKNMADNSPVYFRARRGEKVQGLTGIVITTKPGIREAARNTNIEYYDQKRSELRSISIKKGERFFVLTYLGEGVYKVWYKEKMYETHLDPPQFKKINDPLSVWWVKIKNRKGQIGWTKLVENFDDMDACS